MAGWPARWRPPAAPPGAAVGIVRDGTVQMLCGTAKITLKSSDAADYSGQLVRISASSKGVALSPLTGGGLRQPGCCFRKAGEQSPGR